MSSSTESSSNEKPYRISRHVANAWTVVVTEELQLLVESVPDMCGSCNQPLSILSSGLKTPFSVCVTEHNYFGTFVTCPGGCAPDYDTRMVVSPNEDGSVPTDYFDLHSIDVCRECKRLERHKIGNEKACIKCWNESKQ